MQEGNKEEKNYKCWCKSWQHKVQMGMWMQIQV